MMKNLALADGEGEPVAHVDDRTIGGVPVRVYRADETPVKDAPCLVWFHGGVGS